MLKRAIAIAERCPCGRKHPLSTSVIECRDGATELLIRYISGRYDPARALVVCDENTAQYAERIASPLGCRMFTLSGSAHANEIYTGILSDHIKNTDVPSVMIACGSGSIHDITRFCAHENSVSFVSYPTAASVDGFVSGVAAMTMHGQKLTYPSTSPEALFAEPSVFCGAPERLTASGVGDMIGKITALFDWRVSNILTGEELCPEIYDLMKSALSSVIDAARSMPKDRLAIPVMEGLILSGLAMQLSGNSRPASGSEHHMSHFWEMHVANAPTDALHGEKVGVGTVLMLSHIKANADIVSQEIDFDIGRIFSRDVVFPVYGTLTDGIIGENIPNGVTSSALAKLGKCSLSSNAEKLRSMISSLPDAGFVKDALERVGAPVTLPMLSLPDGKEFISTSLYYSPYVRNRLTFAKIISAFRFER